MTATWYNADKIRAPGSVVLSSWLTAREGGVQRAGLAPEPQAQTVSTGSSREELLDFFGVQAPASGMHVTATSAERVAAVYACVARIAGGISTMPLRIFERVWDSAAGQYQRRAVDDVNLWWLLNEQPCAAFTAASMWELVTQHMLLRGDGLAYIARRNSGAIGELVPLNRDSVEAKRRDNGRLLYSVNDGMSVKYYDQDDMLHFAGLGFDGERSPSVIQRAARQAVGNALAMDEYSGRFFRNGAHPSIVLESPKAMKDAGIDALQRSFANKYSGIENAHRIPLVLTDGVTAKALAMSADDAQLLEARRFQVVDICRAFGVPPHLVGETSAATSWGSGIESMGRAFVTYTLQPHLKRYEQELNRKLFRTARFFVEFDRDALTSGDSKAQAEVDRLLLGGPGAGPGVETPNEVRRRRHKPPVEGGDKLYVPPEVAASSKSAQGGNA